MKVSIDVRVRGADLARAEIITAADFRAIGNTFAETVVERTNDGVDAEGKPIPKGRTGRFMHVTGRLQRSIKARRLSDNGTTVGADVPYAALAQRDRDVTLFGVNQAEADAIAEAVGAAVDRNIGKHSI